jgi:hypothetical protein
MGVAGEEHPRGKGRSEPEALGTRERKRTEEQRRKPEFPGAEGRESASEKGREDDFRHDRRRLRRDERPGERASRGQISRVLRAASIASRVDDRRGGDGRDHGEQTRH